MRILGRKFWAILLSMVCIGSGCGNTKIQNEEKSQSVKSDVSSLNETTEQEKEEYVPPEMKGEITISSFVEQEFLSAAAQQFMDLYQDVVVTINVYNETSGAGSVEDYQNYLNTRIMTGKAEDIIFNSFLPVTKYSEMGVFEDLSRYISLTPEFTDENYFMNILQAAKEKGGETFLIPYMAKFDVVGFSDALLSEQKGIERKLQNTGFSERMDIAKELISSTEKKNAFLIMLNEVSYADYLIEDKFSDFIDMDFYNTEYYYAATYDYDVQAAFYELDDQSGLSHSLPVADSNGNFAINANYCMALNSASDHKDLAWEFMKYLLSEEVQTLPSVHGLAVNRKGFEAAIERYYNFYTEGNRSSVDKEGYSELLQNWVEQINDCDTVDSALWTLIEEENRKFFEGKQAVEDTASVLQRKVEQYFNE